MPLFLKNKICFIHIPKCGGTTFVKEMEEQLNDSPLFYNTQFFRPSHPNEHSPQHSTYEELKRMNMVPEDFEIIAVVRDPYERFLSEYRWRIRKALIGKQTDQDEFAKMLFLSNNFWDNHNKSQRSFLSGGEKIIKTINIKNLNDFFDKRFNIKIGKENTSGGNPSVISKLAKEMVDKYWRHDNLLAQRENDY